MYKVVLVDDEAAIRNGIVNLIDWSTLGCEVTALCSNGEEALLYIRENPVDLAITDIKMPVMDGIRLVKEIYEHHREIKTIMLTAYSEFELAQQAIRYGAVDFVVKNDFLEELPGAIKKAIEQKIADKEKQEMSQTSTDQMKGMILDAWMKNNRLGKEWEKKTDLHELEEKRFCVCSCSVICQDQKYSEESVAIMVKNLLKAAEIPYEYYITEIYNYDMTIVFCEVEDCILTINQITHICNTIFRMTEEFMRMTLKFGVSEVAECKEELSKAYRQALSAKRRTWTDTNEISYYVRESQEEELDIRERFKEIFRCVLEKDEKGAEKRLDLLAEDFSAGHGSIDKIRLGTLNFVSALYRHLNSNFYDIDAEKEEDKALLMISQAVSAYHLYQICRKSISYASRVIGSQQEKYYLIKQIDEYISKNYGRNFSIVEMSGYLKVSAGYISRVYKQKTGITVVEKINRHRMEKAKQFLERSTMKIYEVAESVGIEDPAYFTKVFTKYTGMSPSEYRSGGC